MNDLPANVLRLLCAKICVPEEEYLICAAAQAILEKRGKTL